MIRTDTEYRRALQRLKEETETIRAQRDHLAGLGLSDDEVERAMQPMLAFHAQLEEEVDAYDKMKRGDLGPLQSLTAIGRWLVGARIARGPHPGRPRRAPRRRPLAGLARRAERLPRRNGRARATNHGGARRPVHSACREPPRTGRHLRRGGLRNSTSTALPQLGRVPPVSVLPSLPLGAGLVVLPIDPRDLPVLSCRQRNRVLGPVAA